MSDPIACYVVGCPDGLDPASGYPGDAFALALPRHAALNGETSLPLLTATTCARKASMNHTIEFALLEPVGLIHHVNVPARVRAVLKASWSRSPSPISWSAAT